MRNTRIKALAIVVLGASFVMTSAGALADEWPFISGDYWVVTGIDIKDGGGWKYANWLADEWRKDAEFAKSKGWIKDYKVLANVHDRSDEPDLYLIRVREEIVSGAEGEKRAKEYADWNKKTIEKMVGESGNRAEYREVMSTSLLQELNFRN
ncbi:MAG: hypothetical protein BMS9Abin32_614 [Gammaproteobacteria bacterium]|nr:MAG: hypothetical protein BMS9Abin32_614 [Gammaproteobacteria bacterium]